MSAAGGTPPRQADEDTVLHVSNLTRNVSDAHLLEIFSTYGRVLSVDLGAFKLPSEEHKSPAAYRASPPQLSGG